MDKFIGFLKNKWTKFGVSFLSPLYAVFLVFVLWLSFAFYLSPTNSAALFILYVFINFLYGALVFYTRKQFVTRFVASVCPLIVFAIMIAAFGQWYLIVPPLAISALSFLIADTDETFKTVVGTIYLLLFVVGALVYITLLSLNLTLQSALDIECDANQRSQQYHYSTDGTYRLVQYIDDDKTDRHTVSYYVEKTEDDIHLPFLECMNFIESKRILVTVYEGSENFKWTSDTTLFIDGKTRDMKELFKDEAKEKKPESTKITLVTPDEKDSPDETTAA